MKELSFVTGGNGHLGNTLVRELLSQGKRVRTSVRNMHNTKPFQGLDCEIVYAEMLDKDSLIQAMQGVDILYHVAAVFKHWSKNPEEDIIGPNRDGTKNVLEAAAEVGVKKIVYVSSIAALDHAKVPMNETTWATDFPNSYYTAKQVAEQTAWEVADTLNLKLISILPSSMIGPNLFGHSTPTMNVLQMIINNKLPIDPNFCFNYVHVQDVAKGMILAAEKGRQGERYILATEPAISTTQVIDIAQSLFSNITRPEIASKPALMEMAKKMEQDSEMTGKQPLLLVGNVEHYYHADARIDISKAQKELDYSPRLPKEAIKETLMYLSERS